MTAEAPESMMTPMPQGTADRRPAIWPWLVMPLITLTLFYCLDQLRKKAEDGADLAPAKAIYAPTEPTTP